MEELKRTSTKLFEATFLNNSAEETLRVDAYENSDVDSDGVAIRADTSDHDVVDSVTGDDGSIYELKRARPKKKSNRPGNQTTSLNNARGTYNFNNKGGYYAPRVSDALSDTIPPSGCIRCGNDSHNWRRCHLPFQRQLAFPIKNGPNPQSINMIPPLSGGLSLSVTEKPRLQMPELIEKVPASWPNPIDTSDRLAEDEWVSKWNAKSHSQSEDV